MASLQQLSTALSTDLLQSEFLHEALKRARDVDVVASIVDETLDSVKSATPQLSSAPEGPDPGSNGVQPPGRVGRFLEHLKWLVERVHKLEPLVRPVCEFAFVFLEWAVMDDLTTSPRAIRAMKQVWPAESAEIESILARVKSQMEENRARFDEAMLVIKHAVNSRNTRQRTQSLRRYEAIKSIIQPVFDTCLQYVKQAQDILKALEPKVENVIEESKNKAVMASSYTVAAAGIAALAITGAWMVAAPVAVVTTAGCFGMSIHRRHELRGDLEYYNTEIMLIIDLNRMKVQLISGHTFLLGQTKKSE